METNGNDAAFATTINPVEGAIYGVEFKVGLTKREWFAGLLLQGFMASTVAFTMGSGRRARSGEDFAELAVYAADALITRLNATAKADT